MRIGRRSTTKVFRPNSSKDLYKRAQRQLEGHAVSLAEKYSHALNVDGPNMLFWEKRDGSIPCSCRAVNASSLDSDIIDVTDLDVDELPSVKAVLGEKATKEGTGRVAKTFQINGKAKPLSTFEAPVDRQRITPKDKITSKNLDDYLDSGEYNEDDILDALNADLTPEGLEDLRDPFNLFADKIIDCPICLGTGHIDGWQPHNGLRMVFDTSNIYNFNCDGCDLDDTAKPTVVTVPAREKVTWLTKLPFMWYDILRLNVYNGSKLIHPDWYTLTWTVSGTGSTGIVTQEEMSNLQNVDSPILFSLVANEEFPFTHMEFVFTFAPLIRGQIPEMPQAYEDEFEDWTASSTFELPLSINIAEGDYLTEAKYNRIWKVNSVNYKKTAGGVVFGLSVEVRAIHRFEKIFSQLNVFRDTQTGLIGSKYP